MVTGVQGVVVRGKESLCVQAVSEDRDDDGFVDLNLPLERKVAVGPKFGERLYSSPGLCD